MVHGSGLMRGLGGGFLQAHPKSSRWNSGRERKDKRIGKRRYRANHSTRNRETNEREKRMKTHLGLKGKSNVRNQRASQKVIGDFRIPGSHVK